MTKEEFIQLAAIALAGNPRFTNDKGRLCTNQIICEVDSLANEVDLEAPFDDFTINEEVTDIRKCIGSIDETMEQSIMKSLSEISESLKQS